MNATKALLLKIGLIVGVLAAAGTFVFVIQRKAPAEEGKELSFEKFDLSLPGVVPPDLARRVAEDSVVNTSWAYKTWVGAALSREDPVPLFDLEGKPSGWLFKVVGKREYVGYITISARYDFFPEKNTSPAEFPIRGLDTCREVARSVIGELSPQLRFLYLGGNDYFVQFFSELREDYIVLHLPEGKLVPLDNLRHYQSLRDRVLAERTPEETRAVEKAWEKYR
jgi:hypothetical protein